MGVEAGLMIREQPPPPNVEPPLLERLRRGIRHPKRLVSILGGVVVLFVVVWGWLRWQAGRQAEMQRAHNARLAEAQRIRHEELAAEAARVRPPPPNLTRVLTPTPPPPRPLCGPLKIPCPEDFVCTAEGTCEQDNMVYIPEGTFRMGCDPESGRRCTGDELPPHTLTLSAYAIDKTEVTVAAYRACVESGDCTPPVNKLGTRPCNFDLPDRDDHPVNCISWWQASRYCDRALKRLPTEAQWERAARGDDGRPFPWGWDEPDCAVANIFRKGTLKECVGTTRPVGSYPGGRSPYGALDMIGNVIEWVSDYYDRHAYYEHARRDPLGPTSGTVRVLRGSSFGDASFRELRASARYHLDPNSASELVGFRCAKPMR